jgi:hypothetical protein
MTPIGRLTAAICASCVLTGASCGKDSTTSTSPTPTTTTITFASTLSPGASSARAFSVSQSGTIAVTLTGLGTGFPVGLGIGIPAGGIAGCSLSTVVYTTGGSSPQISAAAAAGSYCVAIFDPGVLTGTVGFEISIVTP